MRGRLTGSATRWVASPFDGTATRSVCDADQLRVPTKRAIKMRRSLCAVVIREYQESDRGWAEAFMNDQFGGALQARRGELIDVLALPGFVAERNGQPVGVVTYRRESDECELDHEGRHRGRGSPLGMCPVRR